MLPPQKKKKPIMVKKCFSETTEIEETAPIKLHQSLFI